MSREEYTESDNDGSDSYYDKIEELYHNKDYDGILDFCEKHSIKLDVYDSGNTYNLLVIICEKFDKEAVKFCLNNGCTINDFEYPSRFILKYHPSSRELNKILDFLDYLISKGLDIHIIFHDSLAHGHIAVHEHLINNWRSEVRKNMDNLPFAFRMAARNGSFTSIKYISDKGIYRRYLTKDLIDEAMRECLCVESYFDKERYKMIDYFVSHFGVDITRYEKSHKNSKHIKKYLGKSAGSKEKIIYRIPKKTRASRDKALIMNDFRVN